MAYLSFAQALADAKRRQRRPVYRSTESQTRSPYQTRVEHGVVPPPRTGGLEPIPPTTPARQNPNTLTTGPYTNPNAITSNTIDDPLTNATKITGINYNALPEPLRPANQQLTDEDRAAQKMLEEDEQLRANEDMYLQQQIQRYNAGGGRTTGLNSVVSGPEPRYPEVASRRSDEPLPNNTISPDIMKVLTQLLAYLKGA